MAWVRPSRLAAGAGEDAHDGGGGEDAHDGGRDEDALAAAAMWIASATSGGC
jgi:hypothetical protein